MLKPETRERSTMVSACSTDAPRRIGKADLQICRSSADFNSVKQSEAGSIPAVSISLSYEWLYPGGDKRKSLIGSDFRFGLSAAVGDI